MILPENGSVVIIDDKHNEAFPIIKAFSKKGIATTYYQGIRSEELPVNPIQIIRITVVDLQLIEGENDGHTIANRIVALLKKIIPKNNGPFMLLIWSTKDGLYADELKREITKEENGVVPALIVVLNKLSCLERTVQKESNIEEKLELVVSELQPSFEEEDIKVIKESIKRNFNEQENEDVLYKAKPNAIEIIEKEIKNAIEKSGVFHLFIIWENLVRKSAAKIVNDISQLSPMNESWEMNMRTTFRRMGLARTGKNKVSPKILIKEAVNTFNTSFIDSLEAEIKRETLPQHITIESDCLISQKIDVDVYKLVQEQNGEFFSKNNERIIKGSDREGLIKSLTKEPKISKIDKINCNELVNRYNNVPMALNTRLHIELTPSQELMPGNIYFSNTEKKIQYIETFFKAVEGSPDDYYLVDLEVSPICDYAQDKWKRSRTLPGILYLSIKYKNLKNGDHFCDVQPEFELLNKKYKLRFDFHLFNAFDKDVAKSREVIYRLKRELLLDIIAQLSSHVNRPGISFVS